MADPIITRGISKVIVSLVYYNSLIRDTLEYTIEKPTYNVDHYKYRQNGLVNEPKINSPLANFIKQNGEKGQEFLERLIDFTDLLYSDDSTILKVAADGLRVDHGQHIAIFEAVAPLHEEINSIIRLHMNLAEKENVLENAIVNLMVEDDRFYRAVLYSTIWQEIKKSFEEFNKLMNESKGQPTPASNFVQQDLQKLVTVYMKTRNMGQANDQLYVDVTDAITHMIEIMMGKRPIPEGKTFKDVFENCQNITARLTVDAQKRWFDIYQPCIAVLVADAKARAEKAEEAAA